MQLRARSEPVSQNREPSREAALGPKRLLALRNDLLHVAPVARSDQPGPGVGLEVDSVQVGKQNIRSGGSA